MGFLFGGSKNTTTRADKIGDFQINSASYGEVVPDVLGTTRVSGNVIYWDDFTAHEHKQTQRTGKGGGSKHTNISYTYTVAAALALCEGPISGVGKVWVDKEVYDYPHPSIQLSLFNGAKGQSPWPYVQGKHPEKALPYSGLAYMAGVVDLGDRGSLPNYNFEVRGKLLNTGDGVDVNPADYIVHVLKSAGMSDVQIDGLDNYRKYCAAADMLISSPPSMSAEKAQSIINDIAEMTNAYLFWSNNKLKIVPLADEAINGWGPDKQIKYDLTHDDLIPGSDGQLVLYSRKDSSECYNQASVEFINRANSYEKEVVSFEVVADVQRNGLRPASVKQAHYLYTKKRAMYLAEQLAMKQLYAKNQYTFRLDWAFCRLEPGDLVTLTDDICQLNKQVVVITAVNEANDGQLEITAVGKPPGTYAPAKYDVHENERPFVDYNQAAPSITNLSIIQAPGDIAGDELLFGVTAPNGWGGCNVWVSDSGEAYKQIGTISRRARIGKLVSSLYEAATTGMIKMDYGELKSGTHLDAERGNTVCWLNGECLSYEKATLQANGNCLLSSIVRGQYGTLAIDHIPGEEIVRLDEALFRAPYRTEDIGKKIYIKCTSMNIFGGQEQDLSEVKAYEYTIRPYYIPEVSNLTLYTKYYDLGRGVKSFDVIATFKQPNISSFDTAEGWYRESGGEWKYGGTGNGQVVISGCELGKTYDVRVQVKDIHGNYSQGVTKSIQVVMKSEKPNAPQGFSVSFSDRAYFYWLEVRNADVDYYEVRADMNPGVTAGLIGRSNNTTFSTDTLINRQGKIYLYAHNPIKGYSAPSMVEYNVPQPQRIAEFNARYVIGGLVVEFPAIPGSCRGANVYIDGSAVLYMNNSVFVPLDAGVYTVKLAYVDIFGEGPQSDEKIVAVKDVIDKEAIKRIGISRDLLDESLNQTLNSLETLPGSIDGIVTKIDAANNSINSVVANLQGDPRESGYSAITQLYDSLQLKVSKDNIVSSINLSKEGVQINGDLLHITGKTVFEKNIIAKDMIQANAVTADKISVNDLGAISANLGTVTAGTVKGVSIIGSTFRNDNSSFTIDANGNIRGATLDANSLWLSGLQFRGAVSVQYTVKDGDLCPIPNGYSEGECIFLPLYCESYTAETYDMYDRQYPPDWLTERYKRGSLISARPSANVTMSYGHGTFKTSEPLLGGIYNREAVCLGYSKATNNSTVNRQPALFYRGFVRIMVLGIKR
ncbi:phage tail protein [uncultured Veillonella sp.]|uniref:phage tail protein n=1 Tax=uncultured Veillonella sp. TaxID=159268 RepID=UPI0025D143C4|nr:phage tail protein [uncultured Veillonella sp.]